MEIVTIKPNPISAKGFSNSKMNEENTFTFGEIFKTGYVHR